MRFQGNANMVVIWSKEKAFGCNCPPPPPRKWLPSELGDNDYVTSCDLLQLISIAFRLLWGQFNRLIYELIILKDACLLQYKMPLYITVPPERPIRFDRISTQAFPKHWKSLHNQISVPA